MTDAARHPGLSAATVSVLTGLLEARTGQRVSSDRVWRLDTALRPLLRELGLETLDDLALLLLRGTDPAIADRIVDALLNNETSFFRDAAVFDTVVDQVIAAGAADSRRLRIWSAGCSTGQEPLSMAMALAGRCEAAGVPMPEILASDVSETALARARIGRFTQFEIQRGLPMRQMLRWFVAQPDGDWLADPALLRMIAFRRLNLAGAPWAVGSFDVILCRNVLLYLAPAIKVAVFDRLAAALRDGGLLVLGAGETVIGQTDLFEPSRSVRGAYQATSSKRAAA
nr:protein-glutamate O-methyltransferase CheR [Sphingomonas bacterium]